jgi:hypothetical protein
MFAHHFHLLVHESIKHIKCVLCAWHCSRNTDGDTTVNQTKIVVLIQIYMLPEKTDDKYYKLLNLMKKMKNKTLGSLLFSVFVN